MEAKNLIIKDNILYNLRLYKHYYVKLKYFPKIILFF